VSEESFLSSSLCRGIESVLEVAKIAAPLCSMKESAAYLHEAKQLPSHLKTLYKTPNYVETELRLPKTIDGVSFYQGKLLIEGKELSFEVLAPAGDVSKKPFLVMLPITEGGQEMLRLISFKLARLGFITGTIERRGGVFKNMETPQELEQGMLDTIRHQRAFLDYMSGWKNVDGNNLGAVGLSLGGMVATCLSAVEPRIKGSVIALAGADFSTMISNTSFNIVRSWRKSIGRECDLSKDELKNLIQNEMRSDPMNLAPYVDRDKVLLVNARGDRMMPKYNSELLSKLLGEPSTVKLPFGHYGSLLFLDLVIENSAAFLLDRLSSEEIPLRKAA